MRKHYGLSMLAGALVAGLFVLVQYGLMARQVLELLAQPARSPIGSASPSARRASQQHCSAS